MSKVQPSRPNKSPDRDKTQPLAMISRIPVCVWSTNRDLRINFSDGGGLASLGLKAGQLDGTLLADYLAAGDTNHQLLDVHRRALAGESTTYEREWGGRWWRARVEPVRETDGSISGTAGISLDITDEKRMIDEKTRALSLLQSTLDSTADGILVVDADGKIVSFNARFVEMWRLPRDVIESRDDERALACVLDQLREPDRFLAKVRELYSLPDATSFDVLEFKDGRVFERVSLPQRLAARPIGRVWSFRDVTELRHVMASLEEANERLQELDRVKRNFLASVSHELRTPLAAIQFAADNLRSPLAGALSEKQLQLVDVVQRNVDRLGRLIGNLLDLASLETGRFTIHRSPIDLRDPLSQSLEILRPRAQSAGLAMHEDLPAEAVMVEADLDRMVQVASNLFENALRFARSRISVRLATNDGYATLSVENDGPGIPTESRDRIFDQFMSADADGRSNRLGLGLSIVRALVEAHGGRVAAEDAGTEGARFTVRIPTREADA